MNDILTTVTRDEMIKAREGARGNPQLQFTNDCYQLVRYLDAQIFYRAEAERALKKIRED